MGTLEDMAENAKKAAEDYGDKQRQKAQQIKNGK